MKAPGRGGGARKNIQKKSSLHFDLTLKNVLLKTNLRRSNNYPLVSDGVKKVANFSCKNIHITGHGGQVV